MDDEDEDLDEDDVEAREVLSAGSHIGAPRPGKSWSGAWPMPGPAGGLPADLEEPLA